MMVADATSLSFYVTFERVAITKEVFSTCTVTEAIEQ